MTAQGAMRAALLVAGNESRYTLDNEITPLYIDLTSGILLDLLTALNAANGTRHFVNPADSRDDWYSYTTRNRQWRLGAASDASVSAVTEHVTAVNGWRITADTVINEQRATVDEPDFPLAPIKVWEWQNLPPLPLTIKTGKPLTIDATYSDYVLSCPDLITVSSGDALSKSLSHHGYSSTITLTSAGTTTLKAFSVWGRQAVREPSLTHKAQDLTSSALPRGVRAGPEISGDFVGAFASAIGIGEHMTWRYGQPSIRPTVTVENWLPTAFQIDCFDIVDFTSTQLKVTAGKYEIVGLTETVDLAAPTAYHVATTYTLAQQKIHAAFFALDSSLLDGSADLAY